MLKYRIVNIPLVGWNLLRKYQESDDTHKALIMLTLYRSVSWF